MKYVWSDYSKDFAKVVDSFLDEFPRTLYNILGKKQEISNISITYTYI